MFSTLPNAFGWINIILLLFTAQIISAQNQEVVAEGFSNIAGLSLDELGNLWISECGTGNDDGKVSMLEPDGSLFTVVENLPSFLDTSTHETAGPWKAYRKGNELQILDGAALGGGGHLSFYDLSNWSASQPPMNLSDAIMVKEISPSVINQGFEESNPYRVMEGSSNSFFVVDAAANSVFSLKEDNSLELLHTFPPIINAFTPFPPVIEHVPTCLVPHPSDGILVGNLTGFPFVPGIATIEQIHNDGSVTPFADSLSQIVELEMDDEGNLYALQFALFDSTFSPQFNSASIIKIAADGSKSVFAEGFGPASGMALDGNGGVYISHLFLGQVIHITDLSSLNDKPKSNHNLEVFPNPVSDKISFNGIIQQTGTYQILIYDLSGKLLKTSGALMLSAGQTFPSVDISNLPSGALGIALKDPNGMESGLVIKK
jgi:hypothetical protein